MKGTKFAVVIDWESAGSYFLSELVDNGVQILQMVDEGPEEECFKWSKKCWS